MSVGIVSEVQPIFGRSLVMSIWHTAVAVGTAVCFIAQTAAMLILSSNDMTMN